MALDTTREQAAAWAVRTGDPAFDDWDRFMAWLEANPAHSRAYDEVMLAVGEAAEDLPAAVEAANDDRLATPSRRRWMGGVVAAALAVVAGVGVWQARDASYAVETAPGEIRTIALDGGGQIDLAGGSRIVLDPRDPRLASLEQGQALFTIRHDPASPFTVTVGKDTLVDIGTVFDVKYSGARMAVAVSEGAVAFNPRGQNVEIAPGQMLTSEPNSELYHLSTVPLGEVGEWRTGRLSFQDAALADVAADLSRATGTTFTVTPRSARRTVSGSLLLDPVKADPRTIAPLLGVTVRYVGDTWEIEAR